MAEIADSLPTVAAQPKSASADGVAVTQQSIGELIAADKYLASKRGRTSPAAQIVRLRIVPPGAI